MARRWGGSSELWPRLRLARLWAVSGLHIMINFVTGDDIRTILMIGWLPISAPWFMLEETREIPKIHNWAAMCTMPGLKYTYLRKNTAWPRIRASSVIWQFENFSCRVSNSVRPSFSEHFIIVLTAKSVCLFFHACCLLMFCAFVTIFLPRILLPRFDSSWSSMSDSAQHYMHSKRHTTFPFWQEVIICTEILDHFFVPS